jgi:unsaturated pyranuronate lyase
LITAPIDWTDIPVERVSDDVSRSVVQGDGFTLIRYVYEPGAVFSEHAHPHEQLTMVESGTLVFCMDGEDIVVGPGQMLRVAPSIRHGARVRGSAQVVSLNFFVPARSEHPTA